MEIARPRSREIESQIIARVEGLRYRYQTKSYFRLEGPRNGHPKSTFGYHIPYSKIKKTEERLSKIEKELAKKGLIKLTGRRSKKH
jgi:hypothetical protein